jgi:hypothetical protein
MELLQKEEKGIRMNTLENYYIQHFTHHNNIIDEQSCARHNPLFQLTAHKHSVTSPEHSPTVRTGEPRQSSIAQQADYAAVNRYVHTQSQHPSFSCLYIMFWMFYM